MSPDLWNNPPPGFIRPSKSAPCSPAKPLGVSRTRSDSFHITHKVPVGDTPYVRAKNVQLVDKDPEKAIPLFWAAINAGDRVDSALKDMAIVMKQQNRAEEAIEAIKSLRTRCSDQAQESLDNILLDLYKRCGRIDDQIALLKHKLYLIQQGMAFNGKRTKTARSQGKKFQVSVEQEATRLLGNLGWAFMQQNNYIEAEDAYRRALSIAPDNNKMCNLGICLMKQGRIAEAKENLRRVRPAMADGPRGVDSHLKAFERAQQMLQDLESEMMNRVVDRVEQSRLFDVFLGSSSIWQPQPCRESGAPPIAVTNTRDNFADENVNMMTGINNNGVANSLAARSTKPVVRSLVNSLNIDATPLARSSKSVAAPLGNLVNIDAPPLARSAKTAGFMGNSLNIDGPPLARSTKPAIAPLVNALNIDAPPFHLWKSVKDQTETQFQDPLGGLKRTRSVGNAHHHFNEESVKPDAMLEKPEDKKTQGISTPTEEVNEWDELLPDSANFEESIVAAVIGYTAKAEKREEASAGAVTCQKKVDKRLRVFQDITLSLSPRA